jgi:hypothetical protein
VIQVRQVHHQSPGSGNNFLPALFLELSGADANSEHDAQHHQGEHNGHKHAVDKTEPSAAGCPFSTALITDSRVVAAERVDIHLHLVSG